MSFTRKKLTAVITLATGEFKAGGNTVTLEGLRIVADIDKAGGIAMGTARVRVYGMRLSDMNQLTQLAFHPLEVANNTITILAGDDVVGMHVAYSGTIIAAWPDFSSSPDVFLYIEAMTGYLHALATVPPLSYSGATKAEDVLSKLAREMGLAFENNGVSVMLASPYYPGTALDQAKACAREADIELYIDDDVMAISPKGSARDTIEVPLISADTGLLGYPLFDKMGVSFQTVYNPSIRYGALVKIESVVQPANGVWRMVSVSQMLESERPGGNWFTRGWCTDNALTIIPRP